MLRVVLHRTRETSTATIGELTIGDGVHRPLWTLEPPWRGNRADVSRMPAGVYSCTRHGWNGELVKYKRVYRLLNVPNRHSILLHWGNWPHNTEGCILLGLSYNGSMEDPAVYRSTEAI